MEDQVEKKNWKKRKYLYLDKFEQKMENVEDQFLTIDDRLEEIHDKLKLYKVLIGLLVLGLAAVIIF